MDVAFPLSGKQKLKRCYNFVPSNDPVRVHCGAKLLRRTEKGVMSDATDATNKADMVVRPDFHFDTALDMCHNPMFIVFPGSEVSHVPCTDCNVCSPLCSDCVEIQLLDRVPLCDVVFGVPWDPVEFVYKACDIGHPQNIALGLSNEVQEAVKMVAKRSTEQVITMRGQWLGKYIAKAKDLELENRRILNTMPVEMREVMKTKRLAVMREILVDHNYPDLQIVDDMASGFKLVGEAPSSGRCPAPKIYTCQFARG